MKFYAIAKGIVNIVFKLIYKIKIYGKENILMEEKLIICSNHSHILDPVILAMIFPRQISFMAKKELFKNRILRYVFTKLGAFPVDRKESDISAIKNALRVLTKDGVLGIFPEGTRVSEFNLDNVKSGTALISIKSKSRILPIYIEGNYKFFSKINIYIGPHIDFSEYYGEKLDSEAYALLSKKVLKDIYTIKENQEEVSWK